MQKFDTEERGVGTGLMLVIAGWFGHILYAIKLMESVSITDRGRGP